MTPKATEGLRHPHWRQDPGKPTRTMEVRGRVNCPNCDAKGCDYCNRRGWMIDEAAQKEEWHG